MFVNKPLGLKAIIHLHVASFSEGHRDQVYDVMTDLDPEGLAACSGVGAKKIRQKGNLTTRGSKWVHSLDGHDKLMGYQNLTFPLAIYGCLDTASRKLLWL